METVVIGQTLAKLAPRLESALGATDIKVRPFPSARVARVTMSSLHGTGPSSIFIESDAPGVEQFVSWLRGRPDLLAVPVIMAAPPEDRAAFHRAQLLGADDVVELGNVVAMGSRATRLRGLDPSQRPPATAGQVVLLHRDRNRRRLVGRTLRQAGFDVSFAVHRSELLRVVEAATEVRALIVQETDPPTSLDLIAACRRVAGNPYLPALVVRPRSTFAGPVNSVTQVEIVSDAGGVDDLLFHLNELLNKEVQNARSSKRLLTYIPCEFRIGGDGAPIRGVTYNISREGIFVRSLSYPPPGGHIWLELDLPGQGRVHLRADVVWVSRPGAGARTALPGFAVRVAESACPPADAVIYQRYYDHLLRSWNQDGAAHTFSMTDPFHDLPKLSTEAA